MSLTESDTETEDGKTTSTFSPAHLEDEFGQTIGLPEEILLHILRFVDPKTRISCSLVAHVWRRLYVVRLLIFFCLSLLLWRVLAFYIFVGFRRWLMLHSTLTFSSFLGRIMEP